jgi:hypothetical protein
MPSRLAIAILLAVTWLLPASAQMRIGTTAAGTTAIHSGFGIAATAGFGGRGMAAGGARRLEHGSRGAILLPYPYFNSDDSDAAVEGAQPQIIVVPASGPAPPAPPPVPLESLLIEWHGDHFVRTTTSSASGQTAPDYSEKPYSEKSSSEKSTDGSQLHGRSASAVKEAVQPPRELPPAVLVFRDGRREEVSDYTIMNGTMYSKADYWTSGSWTKKIQIADLDVPATMRINQDRGVKFVLPASPNEVVMRP